MAVSGDFFKALTLNVSLAYLKPFISEVSLVSNFTVDSQIQHYADLAVTPQFMERQKLPSYYYLTPQTLPHFINSAEWNLGKGYCNESANESAF